MRVRDWPELLEEVSELEPPTEVSTYVLARAREAQSQRAPQAVNRSAWRRWNGGSRVLGWIGVGIGVAVVLAALAVAAHLT
jgi:hypothetical protein